MQRLVPLQETVKSKQCHLNYVLLVSVIWVETTSDHGRLVLLISAAGYKLQDT